MGREVRRVPANWEHPKDDRGHHIPMHDRSYDDEVKEWEEERKLWDAGSDAPGRWNNGEDRVLSKLRGEKFRDWHGRHPDPDDYMPDWAKAERTHYQMYENVSEGTPISPPMPTEESLAKWLADEEGDAGAGETANYDQWLHTVKQGYAFSLMSGPGIGVVNGVVGAAELARQRDEQPD